MESEKLQELKSKYKGEGQLQHLTEESGKLVVGKGFLPNMQIDCTVYVPQEYWNNLVEGTTNHTALDQISRMATIPGVISPLSALPDAHAGKGYPVGISCVFDAEDANCQIPPEAIGGDVNCGVRIWRTNIKVEEFLKKRNIVLEEIRKAVPIYTHTSALDLDIKRILEEGLKYLLSCGLVEEKDLFCTEHNGSFDVKSYKIVGQSPRAKALLQLGTIGAGNHYLEIQTVSEIFNEEDAQALFLEKGTVCVSVHTGSRGVGARAILEFAKEDESEGSSILINSPRGARYLEMIKALANYGFCNRAIIGKRIEEALRKTFPEAEMEAISDSPHNLVTEEVRDGKRIISLRKGSTRVRQGAPMDSKGFSSCPSSLPPIFVGGSMTTGGYLIKGGKNSQNTNYTTCHGSGRIIRRKDVHSHISLETTQEQIKSCDVLVLAESEKALSEESESAYKSIDKVVEYCEEMDISERVCKLLPLSVIKG
ncbi:tRNA-splicing ligase RtcB (3'-phosphate/5'-hydroxy nucleic acid ligase) [Nematocida sp. LUAm3]|nr:tRNA-splicing ligase RtcB (3'-phosphate/5'-hydroxy nucleic acid ligase) [Nematocida sp. LUAm3]KAI5175791.1 tRNA-splicing ligase RtcB (3'-phosphate/5'-hydroxy nucleic acid ligase) [Nematocida sp. LUAm2]KAI5178287.1 tRNA-splicing ligase RtcB (3'-phosphate/5'-hydroxy nucleic acid ligase) [Nematocida sp. LUAm1]